MELLKRFYCPAVWTLVCSWKSPHNSGIARKLRIPRRIRLDSFLGRRDEEFGIICDTTCEANGSGIERKHKIY